MTRPQRVLLVDAGSTTQRLFAEACRSLGHSLTSGSSPLQADELRQPVGLWALQALQASEATSGRAHTLERLQALRELPALRDAPCLVLCDDASEATVAGLIAAGADDFLGPHPSAAELRSRLRLHLRPKPAAAKLVGPDRALAAMLEITQSLVSTVDVSEILYTVVRRIADVVHVDRVSIVLVPERPRSTRDRLLADQTGSAANDPSFGYVVAASDDAALSNLRLDLHKYPEIRHVLSVKQPLTIADVVTHPVLDGVRSSVTELGLSSLTLISMVFEGQAMGVLFMRAQHKLGALDAHQIDFCQVLANATAIALRNARILQTLQEVAGDSSARVEAEKRLQLLRRYADVFESAADGIAALDGNARLLYANPGAYRLLGYEESMFPIGSSVYEIVQDRRQLVSLMRAFARGDFPRNVDVRVQRKGGEPIVISCSFSRLHSQDSAVLLSFRDVTEARRTQEQLVHTRNFLQSLIDASVDAIVASDMSGRIILFNAGAQQLYGHDPEDVIGKMHISALYPGDGARVVDRMLASRARGGVGRLEPVRMEGVDKAGNVFPISLSAATIYENGEPAATFGIFADLRERVRVEEQLAQAQEKLASSEKQALVAELAGATAHELNQPLTSVMGYAELLMKKIAVDHELHRAVMAMHRESERMAEIVRKIGKLTRYETKSYVGEQRILDLDRASQDEPQTEPGGAK